MGTQGRVDLNLVNSLANFIQSWLERVNF